MAFLGIGAWVESPQLVVSPGHQKLNTSMSRLIHTENQCVVKLQSPCPRSLQRINTQMPLWFVKSTLSHMPPDSDIALLYNMLDINPGTYHLVNYLHSKEDTAP